MYNNAKFSPDTLWIINLNGKYAVTNNDGYIIHTEKSLRDYYINRKGEMIEGKRYYSVPTKEDFLSWCAERGIDGKSMVCI